MTIKERFFEGVLMGARIVAYFPIIATVGTMGIAYRGIEVILGYVPTSKAAAQEAWDELVRELETDRVNDPRIGH